MKGCNMTLHVDGSTKFRTRAKNLLSAQMNRTSKFAHQEEGSILIFSLFLLIMMLMISGMAVDLMRAETERARLQSTLDRAVLAGASLEQTLDSKEVVLDYFKKAGLGSYISPDDVIVTPGDNSKTVEARAYMSVDSYFMQLLGIDQLDAPAAGQAEESLSNIEISLVLDVSGSMDWYSSYSGDRKIDDLIDAAQDFVRYMQCNPDDSTGTAVCTVEDDTVSISMIPYSEQVSVGESLLQNFNVTNEHTDSSCVDFDPEDFDSTAVTTSMTLKRSGDIDPWRNYKNSTSNDAARDATRTCKPWGSREIVAFENSYTDMQTRIGNLTADGNTSIDIGMKWGVAMLDPAFRTIVASMTGGSNPKVTPAFANRPYDYNARSMQKVVVLMTDGENTHQHMLKPAFRSGNSPIWKHPTQDYTSAFNANRGNSEKYWWQRDNRWHNGPDGGSSATQLTYPQFWHNYNVDFYEEEYSFLPDAVEVIGGSWDAYDYSEKDYRLLAICSAAKAQKIEVFTIGFETSNRSSAIMQKCASSDSHHFDVNGLNISDAFTSIAREIHELRLTN